MNQSIYKPKISYKCKNHGAVLTNYVLQALYNNYTDYKSNQSDFLCTNLMNSLIFIVSDQVLKPYYIKKCISNYLLDFVYSHLKKITFFTSFCEEKEQFIEKTSDKDLANIKNSLKYFNFISVREKSGVELCNELSNVDAEWIIVTVYCVKKYDAAPFYIKLCRKLLQELKNFMCYKV